MVEGTYCKMRREDIGGVRYLTCIKATGIVSLNPSQRNDELIRRGCPDTDCTCQYRSGKPGKRDLVSLHALPL